MKASGPTCGSDLRKYAIQRARLAGSALLGDAHPYFKCVEQLAEEARAQGRELVSFANYDYLGLARDPRMIRAAALTAERYGVGSGASRLVGGHRAIHDELEADIARFIGMEDALVLVSGYMTNASLIGHLLTKRDVIFVDEYGHNSIMIGAEVSRADVVKFDHNDLDHLETLLRKHRGDYSRALVVAEGLYSMDGDIADLPRLVALKKRYDFWIMLDEAHSIGVLGAGGRGLTEHGGVDPGEIDLVIGTLSKSFANVGGFIGGRREVVEWLRFTLPAFVYSVGLPPMVAGAVREGLAIVNDEPWRIEKLHENSRYFAQGARRRGLDIGLAAGAGVIPILFDDPQKCMHAAALLVESGFYAPPIVQVAVPRGQPRIRCFVTCAHRREDIDRFLDTLAATGLAAAPAEGARGVEAREQGGRRTREGAAQARLRAARG